MKKLAKTIIYMLFTSSYIFFFSLGAKCLLSLLGYSFAISLDGKSVISLYPRFIPFCMVLGFLTLSAIGFIGFMNLKYSENLEYTNRVWSIQWGCVFILTLPMIKLWEIVFGFLQRVF